MKSTAALLAVGLALFAGAGCGSGDDGDDSAGTSPTSSTPTATTGATAPGGATGANGATGATGDTAGGAEIDPATGVTAPPTTAKEALTVIHDVLIRQGLDPKVAACVERELGKTLKDEDIKDLNGQPPPGFQDKVAAAAQACTPQ